MPSSLHEFHKVFLQEVRICVPFHLLKFVLCYKPIVLCVLCMDTGDWVYKVNRVINRLMIETQDPLHLPVCRSFISINQRAWLYVSLDKGQKSTCISPINTVEWGHTVCQKAQEPISLLEVDVPFGTVLKKRQISLKRVEYIEKN